MRRWTLWGDVLPFLAIVALAVALVFSIWFEVRHPCVRWESRVCGTDLIPITDGDGNTIWIEVDETPPCKRCVERKP